MWEYKGSRRWHPFNADINRIVDSAYQRKSASVQYSVEGQSYTIDFGRMKQRCDTDPKRCRDVRPPGCLDSTSGPVKWQHKGRNHWQDFPQYVSDAVEAAYSSRQVSVCFTLMENTYEIDFGNMKQRCCEDESRVRDVRRQGGNSVMENPQAWPSSGSSSAADIRPHYWSNVPSNPIVTCGNPTISMFQTLFNNTYCGVWTRDRRDRAGQPSGVPNGYTVSKVLRLENPELWRAFISRRAQVAQMCAATPATKCPCVLTAKSSLEATDLDQSCGECYLFHGAPSSTVASIAAKGFDLSTANAQGLLGAVIYFAENSTKADEYCGVGPGSHIMLVCRVVLGHALYTEEATPNKASLSSALQSGSYHSIQAFRRATTSLNEFGLGNVAQAYPEYLVTYTRR